jgi:helicase MOV-10
MSSFAPSRFKEQVADDLLPYIFTQSGGHFSDLPMDHLKKFKVVVSTCGSAGVFSGVGMARGHFMHIFIDEAGQATEPELFLSIKMIPDRKTNVILSGAPKQLGPVIRSGIARELGLEISSLERLMDRNLYDIKTGRGSRKQSYRGWHCTLVGTWTSWPSFRPHEERHRISL